MQIFPPPHARSTFLTLTIGVVAATVLSAGTAVAQTERETLTGREVSVYNLAGRITVERGTGSDVTVEVARGGRDAAKLKIVSSQLRGRNALRVLYPAGDDVVYEGPARERGWGNATDLRVDVDGTWGNDDHGRDRDGRRVRVKTRGSGTEAWADLTIRVPAGKSVAVYLATGELNATGVDSDLRIDVAAARVTASSIRGRLDIDAGSGAVDVRDATVTEIKIDNGSGGVRVTNITSERCAVDVGSGGVVGTSVRCGTLNVDAGSGSVRLEGVASSDVNVETGSGGVTLVFTTAPKRLAVDAGSSGVTVTLPSMLGAEVDIETGSGGITSDFAIKTTHMARNELRGTIGDGSAHIRIESGSGTVRLRKSAN